MRGERGESRAIYTVITETPDFIELEPAAKLLWYHLKLRLGGSGIDTVSWAQIREQTGLSEEALKTAVSSLTDGGWLIVEKTVAWLRNGLRFEPYLSLDHEQHRYSVQKHLRGLPKLAIVNQFAHYYGLEVPFPTVEYQPTEAEMPPLPARDGRGSAEGGDTHATPTAEGRPRVSTGSRDSKQEVGSSNQEVGIRNKESKDNRIAGDKSPGRSSEEMIARGLMPIVRGVNGLGGLYGTRGGPGRGRTEGQDVDTLATMHQLGHPVEDLEGMILGTIMMREAGELEWADPGESVTTGALYVRKTGVRPFAAIALDYFHKHSSDPRWSALVNWRSHEPR